MKMSLRQLGLTAACLLTSQIASAHISLDLAGTHKSRYGFEMKKGPCGRLDGARGTNIYTYKPGETIKVAITEFVPHPGYFRIAFDPNGDAGFMNPRTVLPINRECMKDPADHCGATDFYNNSTVLLDNLEPHQGNILGRNYSWNVKLPDVECDNCTLQVIQIMTDPYPIHAPYDPAYTSEDIYYQCIDMVLKK